MKQRIYQNITHYTTLWLNMVKTENKKIPLRVEWYLWNFTIAAVAVTAQALSSARLQDSSTGFVPGNYCRCNQSIRRP